MENIKKFIGIGLGFLLVMLCFLSIKAVFLIDSATDTVKEAKNTIQETKQFIQEAKPETISTLKSIKQSANQNAEILARPEVQRSIKLFAQSGDDWARLPANLNGMIHEIRQDTLPAANQTLDSSNILVNQGTKTLQAGENAIVTVDKNIDKIGSIAAKDLEQLSQLLTDPKLNQLLGNLVETSSEVKQICKNLDITTEDLNKSLPEILKELKEILAHIDDGTEQTANFIKGLNKPLTKKQRIYKAAIQILAIAAPTYLRR